MTNIEENKKRGLYKKYDIRKIGADGRLLEVDANAEYFVLRLDKDGGDPKHIRACRKAITTYAWAIRNHLPKLSRDLDRYDDSVNELLACVEAIHAKHKKNRGLRDEMPCPVCKEGKLIYTIAAANGHINARCTDAGCVSFIQ